MGYRKNVLAQYGITKKDVENFNFPLNIDSAEFFQNVTFEIFDLIEKISIEVSDNIPNSVDHKYAIDFKNEKIIDLMQNGFSTKNWTVYGRCYGFQVPNWIRKLQVVFCFDLDNLFCSIITIPFSY